MTGDDVGEFQRLLNHRFKAWKIGKRLAEDDDYGKATRDAAQEVCIGLGISVATAMKDGVTPALRTKMRHPDKRTDAEKQRAKGKEATELRARLRKRFKGGTAGSLGAVQVTPKQGDPHWGGANDVMTQFVEPFMTARGLPIGSGKRTPQKNASIGGSRDSDHLTTKTTTAARDFPTFSGQDEARALAKALGNGGWQPNSFDTFGFAAGGRTFRAQILWGAAIAHGDHVHVGISPG